MGMGAIPLIHSIRHSLRQLSYHSIDIDHCKCKCEYLRADFPSQLGLLRWELKEANHHMYLYEKAIDHKEKSAIFIEDMQMYTESGAF